jgi:hypothetical protein
VKQRLWLIAGFVAVFCLGAIAGGAAIAGSHARQQVKLLDPPGRGSFATLLERRVQLRPEQRSNVEAIVGRYEADRERLLAPVEPAMRERRAAMRREVRATLDADQLGEFDAVTRELDEERARRAGRSAASGASADPAGALGASNR